MKKPAKTFFRISVFILLGIIALSAIYKYSRPEIIDDLQPEDFAHSPKLLQLVLDLKTGDTDQRADILLDLNPSKYKDDKIIYVFLACLHEKQSKTANISQWVIKELAPALISLDLSEFYNAYTDLPDCWDMDPKAPIRASALSLLGELKKKAKPAVPDIIHLLQSDRYNQGEAADALSKIGDQRAFRPLVEVQESKNDGLSITVPEAFYEALAKIAPLDKLSGLLKSKNKLHRQRVIKALGIAEMTYLQELSITDKLLKIMHTDPDSEVRIAAIEALANFYPKNVDKHILNVLQKNPDNLNIKMQCLWALINGGKEYREAVFYGVIDILNQNNNDDFPRYLILLNLKDFFKQNPAKYREILEITIKIAEDSTESKNMRIDALEQAAEIADIKASKRIYDILQKKIRKEGVSYSYVAILGKLKNPEAADYLLTLFQQPEYSGKFHLINALGNTGSEKIIEPLLKMLKDPANKNIHFEIAEALAKTKKQRVIPHILDLLKKKEGEEQNRCRSLIYALDWSDNPEFKKHLLHLLLTEQDPMLIDAILAYTVFPGNTDVYDKILSIITNLEMDDEMSSDYVFSLKENSDPRLEKDLIRIMNSESFFPSIRIAAASALAEKGDPQGLDFVLEKLKDSDGFIRSKALWSLNTFKSNKIRPALYEMLKTEKTLLRHDIKDKIDTF